MPADKLILDFDEYDLNHVVADLEAIRRYNPQRYELEQLTAIVYENVERKIGVGYKDLRHDEFWVRGHMPGMPLLPGVLMCEVAAQVCSYFSGHNNLMNGAMLGFGGIDGVRFRDVVRPGQRLVVVCELTRVRIGRLLTSRFQTFVERKLVGEGEITGIALPSTAPTADTPSG